MEIQAQSQCVACSHLDRQEPEAAACDAFPEGIPQEIYTNHFDHHNPYPGDHGVHFDLIPLDQYTGPR